MKINKPEIKNWGVYVTNMTFSYESVQDHAQLNLIINSVVLQYRKHNQTHIIVCNIRKGPLCMNTYKTAGGEKLNLFKP